jgi:hypothetical protein
MGKRTVLLGIGVNTTGKPWKRLLTNKEEDVLEDLLLHRRFFPKIPSTTYDTLYLQLSSDDSPRSKR